MDYEEDSTFLYSFLETLISFTFRALVAGISLALLAITLKYAGTGKKPKKLPKDESSGNMNEYLDGFLKDAGIKIHKLHGDPLSLPDTTHGFQKKILFFNAKGGLATKRAKLKGLSSIHRAGDATLNMDSLTCIKIRVTLGIHNVNFTSESVAWLGGRIANFKLGAHIKYLKGTAEIEIPLLSLEKPKATSLIIDEIGKITLDVNDLGPLDWFIKNMGFIVLNLFKDMLKDVVAEPIQVSMNKAIGNISIPSFL